MYLLYSWCTCPCIHFLHYVYNKLTNYIITDFIILCKTNFSNLIVLESYNDKHIWIIYNKLAIKIKHKRLTSIKHNKIFAYFTFTIKYLIVKKYVSFTIILHFFNKLIRKVTEQLEKLNVITFIIIKWLILKLSEHFVSKSLSELIINQHLLLYLVEHYCQCATTLKMIGNQLRM